MLREAVRCGIKLDIKGIALQPALYKAVPIRAQNLIPQELTSRLEAELSGDVLGRYEQHRARIEELINDFLRVEQLVHIVETAAAYDTVVDIDSDSDATNTIENVGPAQVAAGRAEDEVAAIRDDSRYTQGIKGIEGPNGEIKALDGGPVGPDGLKDPKESLSVWWIPLEVMLLQTRRYGPGTYAERTRWR